MSLISGTAEDSSRCEPHSEPLLAVRHVVQEFPVVGVGGVRGGTVKAVSDVSFELSTGETLGIVGETGSGKSTLALSVLQTPSPKSGEVVFEGLELTGLRGRALAEGRRRMSMIYQDPFGSLDPKWNVMQIVEEPMRARGIGTKVERRSRAAELLDLVGIEPSVFGARRPAQLSGGQCQRVAIARALMLGPSLMICDEAVSSLDVLIQAQVLNLFERLRSELGLAYLFIAHNLAMVRQVSDRIGVMYLGRLCEIGPTDAIYWRSRHPYTSALVASIPPPDPNTSRVKIDTIINGETPSPIDPPSGCRFRTRCPRAEQLCAVETPQLRELSRDHYVACHFPLEVAPDDGTQFGAAVPNEMLGR